MEEAAKRRTRAEFGRAFAALAPVGTSVYLSVPFSTQSTRTHVLHASGAAATSLKL